MKVQADIDAGVCGFQTRVVAHSEDPQQVQFDITSGCEKIQGLAEILQPKQPIDAYQEISPAEGVIMQTAKSQLTGCCAGCAVPAGIFKALQVAAGLALPKDITITIKKS
jgi:hypothetical protein